MKKVREAQEEAARKNLTLLDGTALSHAHESLKHTVGERCSKLKWLIEADAMKNTSMSDLHTGHISGSSSPRRHHLHSNGATPKNINS
jgi:hypothetical protein